MRSLVAGAFTLALFGAWAVQACGDGTPSPGIASGAAGAAGVVSQGGKSGKAGKAGQGGTGGTAAGGGGGDCAAPPRPEFVPESWTLHHYACDCPFYSAGVDPKEIPGPMWAPCDEVLQFEAAACEIDKTQTVLGRPAKPWGTATLSGSLYVRETPSRWLHQMGWFLDFDPTNWDTMSLLHIVRDTDGKVRHGTLFPGTGACKQTFGSLSDGIYSTQVQRFPNGKGAEGSLGIVATRITDVDPLAILDLDLPPSSTALHHMKSGWLKVGGIATMVPWGGGAPVTVIDPAKIPYGAAYHFKLSQDDRAIFSLQETNRGFGSWTPTDGQRVLLQWDDPLKGATRLGTDFEQMVWTYGEDP
ncbi:MAG: hypothetical protein LC118_06320, partial [Dehalococcoidia bacterium]|nr:hypothetical protein [Dehalococcoidia bacterium]